MSPSSGQNWQLVGKKKKTGPKQKGNAWPISISKRKQLKEKHTTIDRQISGAMIRISNCEDRESSTERTITITGSGESVALAQYLINTRSVVLPLLLLLLLFLWFHYYLLHLLLLLHLLHPLLVPLLLLVVRHLFVVVCLFFFTERHRRTRSADRFFFYVIVFCLGFLVWVGNFSFRSRSTLPPTNQKTQTQTQTHTVVFVVSRRSLVGFRNGWAGLLARSGDDWTVAVDCCRDSLRVTRTGQ